MLKLQSVSAYACALVCALLLAPSSVYALGVTGDVGDLRTGYAGVLFGAAIASEARATHLTIAGHAGLDLNPRFSLGLYTSFVALGPDPVMGGVPANAAQVNEIIYALEPNYWISRDFGLYIGAKTGLGITTNRLVNNVIVGGSSAALALGPSAGFSIPIANHVNFGEEMNVIYITSRDALLLFNILAQLTYRF